MARLICGFGTKADPAHLLPPEVVVPAGTDEMLQLPGASMAHSSWCQAPQRLMSGPRAAHVLLLPITTATSALCHALFSPVSLPSCLGAHLPQQ